MGRRRGMLKFCKRFSFRRVSPLRSHCACETLPSSGERRLERRAKPEIGHRLGSSVAVCERDFRAPKRSDANEHLGKPRAMGVANGLIVILRAPKESIEESLIGLDRRDVLHFAAADTSGSV